MKKKTGYTKLKVKYMKGSKGIPRIMAKKDLSFAPSIESNWSRLAQWRSGQTCQRQSSGFLLLWDHLFLQPEGWKLRWLWPRFFRVLEFCRSSALEVIFPFFLSRSIENNIKFSLCLPTLDCDMCLKYNFIVLIYWNSVTVTSIPWLINPK